jgi:hypothetical protein
MGVVGFALWRLYSRQILETVNDPCMTTRKPKPNQRRLRQRTQAKRREIAAMDFVSSGTLLTRTKVCGKPHCRCATDPGARHGPYYEFNRRVDGRLVHRAVTAELAPREQRALDNHRRIQTLLAEWELETVKELFEPNAD